MAAAMDALAGFRAAIGATRVVTDAATWVVGRIKDRLFGDFDFQGRGVDVVCCSHTVQHRGDGIKGKFAR